jgi:pimeloyl-ACP methyl ester carboxylesterase
LVLRHTCVEQASLESTTAKGNLMSNEKVLRINGVDLCVETFGEGPAVLLIGGHSASMLWWDEEFCSRLAAGGRTVIRYDNRDTGRSTQYPLAKPEYSGTDLIDDAAGVLDALGVERAHIVGQSMGGAMAQNFALRHPGRVATLTLLSTSALGDDLPGMADRLRDHYASPEEPDWTDRAAVIEYLVREFRAYAGSLPFDEAEIRAIAGRDYDRTTDIQVAFTNHSHLQGDDGPWRHRLGEITAPTLVMHGTEDPLFPLPHGETLAREIPNARLVTMAGAGHELPRAVWDVAVHEILEHTHGPGGAHRGGAGRRG